MTGLGGPCESGGLAPVCLNVPDPWVIAGMVR